MYPTKVRPAIPIPNINNIAIEKMKFVENIEIIHTAK
jgi:hypothetical protein